MEKVDLTLLVHRAMSDPVFRQQLLADPEVAVNEAGWDLPPDDLAALKAWHANLRDVTKLEELKRSLEDFLASRVPKTCD
ncbi:MAG: Os1348 family NHLP clan protein [Armatimonadota bacterium]